MSQRGKHKKTLARLLSSPHIVVGQEDRRYIVVSVFWGPDIGCWTLSHGKYIRRTPLRAYVGMRKLSGANSKYWTKAEHEILNHVQARVKVDDRKPHHKQQFHRACCAAKVWNENVLAHIPDWALKFARSKKILGLTPSHRNYNSFEFCTQMLTLAYYAGEEGCKLWSKHPDQLKWGLYLVSTACHLGRRHMLHALSTTTKAKKLITRIFATKNPTLKDKFQNRSHVSPVEYLFARDSKLPLIHCPILDWEFICSMSVADRLRAADFTARTGHLIRDCVNLINGICNEEAMLLNEATSKRNKVLRLRNLFRVTRTRDLRDLHDRLVTRNNQIVNERRRRHMRGGSTSKFMIGKVEVSAEDCILRQVTPDTENYTQLRTKEDFETEGMEMHHCVSGYFHSAYRGNIAIFHIQHGENHATLEVDSTYNRRQLQAKYNRTPDPELSKFVDEVMLPNLRKDTAPVTAWDKDKDLLFIWDEGGKNASVGRAQGDNLIQILPMISDSTEEDATKTDDVPMSTIPVDDTLGIEAA